MMVLIWYFKMFLAGSRGGETGEERKDGHDQHSHPSKTSKSIFPNEY